MTKPYRGIHVSSLIKEPSTTRCTIGGCELGGEHPKHTFGCTTLEPRKTQLQGMPQTKDLIEYSLPPRVSLRLDVATMSQ